MSDLFILYLKTHNKTGLKYLGKTTRNPYDYNGSGKYWLNHLSKHGNDISTELLYQTADENEFRKVAVMFSKLYNIVDSNDFANLCEEQGQGGHTLYSKERNKKISVALKQYLKYNKRTGWKHNQKTIEKIKASWTEERKQNQPPVSDETKRKQSEAHKGKVAWNKNKTMPFKGKPKTKVKCPHCGKQGGTGVMNRWHFDNCRNKP